jgi:hypothetical protein
MGWTDSIRDTIVNWLLPTTLEDRERLAMLKAYGKRREYREGVQRKPLVVKVNQADDNLTLNFTGLIIDRGISMLFGDGVDFDFSVAEGETDARAEFIDAMIEANVYPIFLHKTAQLGGTYGTNYTKIIPGGLPDGQTRLVPINPHWVTMTALPEDMDTIWRYTIQYNAQDENSKDVSYKEETDHLRTADGFSDAWSVKNFVMRDGKNWELVKDTLWEYPFAPIVHWQNLPDAESMYGDPDITDDMIIIQDALNFVASNIQRIIRYHAHPKTWGRGFSTTGTASWGADEMVTVNGQDAMIANLEMQTDLASSREFLHYLRGVLFDISRTVDLSSMTDKIGALTNFALRVLYKDALDKLNSKRVLYGWALSEINRRCLILAGIDTDTGGAVVWPDALPTNTGEQAKELQIDLGEGLVDKETASTLRGYDWETVQARLEEEKANDTILGDQLMKAFEQGQGAGSQMTQQPAQMQAQRQMAEEVSAVA